MKKKVLSLLVVMMMTMGLMTGAASADGTITGLDGNGTEESPYLINNLDELQWFQGQVDIQAADGSTQFAGKYFKLTNDIDLSGINWEPIGSMTGDHGSFKGVFDGDGHTISNLNVQTTGNGLGFFAYTAGSAEIKNLTFNNVTVKSTDNSNHVGGVVGNAFASTKITNVHVTGTVDISGRGYIGGIVGHGYVVMDNVSVEAEGTISSTFWCAGGILGYGGEGVTNISNAVVEGTGTTGLTITSAAGGLGAIVGMAEDNDGTQPISGSNLSASNVDIKTYEGAYGTSYANYALGYLYGGNPTSQLTGTLTVEDVNVVTSTGETPTINDAVAQVGETVYFDLYDAFYENRGEDELNVVLLRDVTHDSTLTAANSGTVYVQENGSYIKKNVAQKTTFDLNGNTFTSTVTDGAALRVHNNASLTIVDTVGGGKIVAAGDGVNVGSGGSTATLTVEGGTIEAVGITVNVAKNSVLTVDGGVVDGGEYGAVLGGDNTTINVKSGTLAGNTAISSHSSYENTVVAISGGTVSGDVLAIYQPQNGTTTISGGTVTGATAINVKSGTLNVTDGTVSGTGEYADYVFTGGSFTSTGDGIVVENAQNYNSAYETPTVSITGGTITSVNGVSVVSYAASQNDTAITGFIAGGTFSSDPTLYLADGYAPTLYGGKYFVDVAPNVTMVAQINNGTKYQTLKAAFAAVKDGDTIQLLAGTISEGTIKLPATLKNVTIKGADDKASILKDMTLQAADGNTLVYEGLTFDGIVFDNSNILVTGWRSGTESYKDWTITNCEFKNIVRTSGNHAAVHINIEVQSAVNGFTFTSNVIDGVSGGSNSGIYGAFTGNITISNNTINNVAFRPYIAQIADNDGIADNFVVSGNTFSGSSVGRAQAYGSEGTDSVALTVTGNIFKDITDAQQICYWSFSEEGTVTSDISNNYYDIDIAANPSKIYWNSAATSVQELAELGVYPIYTALNEDGSIDTTSLYEPVAEINGTLYDTLTEAVEAVENDQMITVLADCTETVTVAEDVTFNLNVADGKKFTGSITAGSNTTLTTTQNEDNSVTYTFDYTAPSYSGGGSYSAPTYTITTERTEDGSITVSPKRAEKGDNVTITVTPDEGYELDELIVTDNKGNDIKVTKKADGKYTFKMPAGKVSVDATFASVVEMLFVDVDADDWFYDAVKYAYDNDIMAGMGDNKFGPNAELTRAMVAQVLYNLDEDRYTTSANLFADVIAGEWYVDAINWAVSEGIFAGYGNGNFGTLDSVTREQLAMILCNYAVSKGYEISGSITLGMYADADKTSGWAVGAMEWAVANGILRSTDGLLTPTAPASRAEVAYAMMMFCENILG